MHRIVCEISSLAILIVLLTGCADDPTGALDTSDHSSLPPAEITGKIAFPLDPMESELDFEAVSHVDDAGRTLEVQFTAINNTSRGEKRLLVHASFPVEYGMLVPEPGSYTFSSGLMDLRGSRVGYSAVSSSGSEEKYQFVATRISLKIERRNANAISGAFSLHGVQSKAFRYNGNEVHREGESDHEVFFGGRFEDLDVQIPRVNTGH